jgi:hypothetical protein
MSRDTGDEIAVTDHTHHNDRESRPSSRNSSHKVWHFRDLQRADAIRTMMTLLTLLLIPSPLRPN